MQDKEALSKSCIFILLKNSVCFFLMKVNDTFTWAVPAGCGETDGFGDSGACFISKAHCPVMALQEKWVHYAYPWCHWSLVFKLHV